jgi:hypothetical protein
VLHTYKKTRSAYLGGRFRYDSTKAAAPQTQAVHIAAISYTRLALPFSLASQWQKEKPMINQILLPRRGLQKMRVFSSKSESLKHKWNAR